MEVRRLSLEVNYGWNRSLGWENMVSEDGRQRTRFGVSFGVVIHISLKRRGTQHSGEAFESRMSRNGDPQHSKRYFKFSYEKKGTHNTRTRCKVSFGVQLPPPTNLWQGGDLQSTPPPYATSKWCLLISPRMQRWSLNSHSHSHSHSHLPI